MPAIEVEGRRFGWRAVGAGPPLLLVNGYAASAADWDPGFLARLGESHEVICPDNRGIGESELGEGDVSAAAMAADLLALLDALGIGRLPVVGWSMGGFVAQALATSAPERASALTLIGTDPGGRGAAVCPREAYERLVDRSGTPREQASRLISLLFPPAVAAPIDRDFGEVVAAARARLDPLALDAQEDAMRSWHRNEQPAPVDPPPTLVLHGAEDEVIPAANAPLLAQRWQARRTEVLPGCGHAVMAQEPERLADLIVDLGRVLHP